MVLGLRGCPHCKSLKDKLTTQKIHFEAVDADENDALADRVEKIVETNIYPIVVIEKPSGSVYLYREDEFERAKPIIMRFGTKIGCVSVDDMIMRIKNYTK